MGGVGGVLRGLVKVYTIYCPFQFIDTVNQGIANEIGLCVVTPPPPSPPNSYSYPDTVTMRYSFAMPMKSLNVDLTAFYKAVRSMICVINLRAVYSEACAK